MGYFINKILKSYIKIKNLYIRVCVFTAVSKEATRGQARHTDFKF